MHTNLSLARNGKNIFYDPNDSYSLSSEAYGFIAGLMTHVKAMTAICNPTVNSYKRLVPGYEAPCYIAWSARNRSPLIRIPACTPKATRVELRSPDPTANPYLVFAAAIRAGLDGISRGLTPPAPIQANIFHMSRHELEEKGIESLPVSLEEALDCLRRDQLMRDTLGEYAFESYTRAKTQEWNEYRNHVSAWEIEQYLVKY
jgi:glutamine synthetase